MDNNKGKMPAKYIAQNSLPTRVIIQKFARDLAGIRLISPTTDLYPFLIDHAIQKIMTFFNVEDSTSARLLRKWWTVEGRRQIFVQSYLSPKLGCISKQLTEKELMNFLPLAEPSAMFKLLCGNKDILDIIQKFPKLAEKVRELKYETDAPNQLWKLAEAMDKLPNLRILDINYLSLQDFPVYSGTWNSSLIAKNSQVYQFYNQLASLVEIRIDYPFRPKDNDILVELGNRLKNVSNITLDNPNIEMQNFLISDQVEWPLSNITFKLWIHPEQVDQFFSSIRQFFIKNSNTLKILNIDILITLVNAQNLTVQKPWEDDWLLPVDFPVLETMIISSSEGSIWSLLTNALRLPRLKKLVLPRVPELIDQKIQEWEQHPLAAGRKIQSLSIEQVELNSISNYSSAAGLWPNLKTLQVCVNAWSGGLSPSIFSCWEGLEILELDFRLISLSEFAWYQEWLLGGVKCLQTYKKGTVIVNESDLYSTPASKLADLKNLKCLTLHLPSSTFFLGDFLVYNCLQFMTNLQSLRFGGQPSVSDEASKMLKYKLGGIVSDLDNHYT